MEVEGKKSHWGTLRDRPTQTPTPTITDIFLVQTGWVGLVLLYVRHWDTETLRHSTIVSSWSAYSCAIQPSEGYRNMPSSTHFGLFARTELNISCRQQPDGWVSLGRVATNFKHTIAHQTQYVDWRSSHTKCWDINHWFDWDIFSSTAVRTPVGINLSVSIKYWEADKK